MKKISKEAVLIVDNDLYVLSADEVELLKHFKKHQEDPWTKSTQDDHAYQTDHVFDTDETRTFVRFRTIRFKR